MKSLSSSSAQSRAVSQYEHYYTTAYENISLALNLESDSNQIFRALELYDLGIMNAKQALSMNLDSFSPKIK